MIISVSKWLERAKFLVLFLLFTILLYHAMDVISTWIEPKVRYEEPDGAAVKVFGYNGNENGGDSSMVDRLKLFYWYGE
ncbi:YqzK family protein [Paenibacillus turpanensis]|uniref:YqzK family protein n=1 Tax=Paenibacillus turpanensis TaxID=2689078 RepID=UPI00140DC14E|nr:YqzK family protein [Paenibacillus turpanensis]